MIRYQLAVARFAARSPRSLSQHPALSKAVSYLSIEKASSAARDGDTISQKIVFETEREINHDPTVAAKATTPFLDVLASIRRP